MTKTKAARALLDAMKKNSWNYAQTAAWAGLKNKGEAWNIMHGKRKPSKELNIRLFGVKARRRPANWYWKHRLLKNGVRRCVGSMQEACARVVDDYLKAYPVDIFPAPLPREHGETVGQCSAAALRAILPNVARDIRALELDGEEYEKTKGVK